MADDKLNHKRKNGIFYTPMNLARYLAEPMIDGTDIQIFDPAYGDGSLLLAAESIFIDKRKNGSNIEIFGCDIHPINGLLEHLPQANLREEDFFRYTLDGEYDLILTNPPYIRHQSQDITLIKEYKSNSEVLNFLSNSSDLWAYFLVKSTSHLKKGGSIGAILPWSFIQADYAIELREWLMSHFKKIKVLALNNKYFDSVQERVVLLWMSGFGEKTKSIELAFGRDIDSQFTYFKLSKNDWLSNRVVRIESNLSYILGSLKNIYGFSDFGLCANSRIGIVTGANKYFIKKESEAKRYGFTDNQLLPIITTSKELPFALNGQIDKINRLLCIDENCSVIEGINNYIQSGVESEFHLRSHSKVRKPWYSIDTGKVPDAFFPYRVGKIPYLVPNDYCLQSTNSIHRIYYKELNSIEKKWIVVSMLSIYSQLSLEAHAKTYGRGMLKIEPGSLNRVLVYKNLDKSISEIYSEILIKLKNQEKNSAVDLATDFLNLKINIPIDFQILVRKAWEEIKHMRNR